MSSKATFSFYINKLKKSKNEKWPIYMRLTFNRRKKELDTGCYEGTDDWNLNKQRTRYNDTTNDALSCLESRFYDRLNDFRKSGSLVDLEQLKDFITNSELNNTPKLKDYISKYCLNTGLRKDVSRYTKHKYLRVQKTTEAYLLGIKKNNLLITEVDFKFIDGYDSFLRNSDFFGISISPNTLAKYHTRLKTICLKALNE